MALNRGVNLKKAVALADKREAAAEADAKKHRKGKTRADYEKFQWGVGGWRPGFQPHCVPIDLTSEKILDKASAAEKALLLFYQVLVCDTLRIELRMTAAREILDRVWGKPPQGVHLSGSVGILSPEQIEEERKRRWALAAPLVEQLAPILVDDGQLLTDGDPSKLIDSVARSPNGDES